MKLSRPMTSCPSANRLSQRCEPRKPAAPVMRMRMRTSVLEDLSCDDCYEPSDDCIPRALHWASRALFPVNATDKAVSGDLVCLTAAAIDEPQVALVDDGDEVADLALDGIWRPDRNLRLEPSRVGRREEHAAVRAVAVHHHQAIAAGL